MISSNNDKCSILEQQINEMRSILSQSLFYISFISPSDTQNSENLQRWKRLVNKIKQREIERNCAAYTIQSFWKCTKDINKASNKEQLLFSDFQDFEKIEIRALHEIGDEMTMECLTKAIDDLVE